jgi:prevent-host-death family protein
MKLSRDIQSLSVFKRDSSKYLKQIKKTGEPLVLTVNGKAAAVVLDPDSYQSYLREKHWQDTMSALRESRDDVKSGQVQDAEDFFREFEERHGIPSE